MASFPISGLGGSGLDIPSMLAQLEKAESTKLNPYLQKQSNFDGRVSGWGKVSSALDAMKTNLDKLKDEGFNGVSVGTNTAFKATAGKGTQANSYSVIVKTLASAHKISSSMVTDKDANQAKNNSTIEITQGDGEVMTLDIDKNGSSLTSIAKKINDQNGDISASVMEGEKGEYRLVVTSKKTGSEGEMKISVTGDSDLSDLISFDPDATNPVGNAYQVSAAEDAVLIIDGETYTRSSNTISDAIDGLTIELRDVSEKDDSDVFKPETLSVTADTSKVKSLIEDFVKVYNGYLSTATSLSAYKEPVKGNSDELAQQNPANGPLFGDGSLRRLTSQMKAAASGSYGSSEDDIFKTLASIGITVKYESLNEGEERTSALGTLSIDSDKLNKALKENPKEVEKLFLGKGDIQGIKGRMEDVLKTYLGDSDSIPKDPGIISNSVKGIKEQEKRVAKQIERIQINIEASLKRSELEFQRLDRAMNDMTSTSNRLQSVLAGL